MRHWLVVLIFAGLCGCRGLHEGATERSIGEIADDTMIVSTVNTHALRAPSLSFFDISVESHRGVVILYGNVTTAAAEKDLVEFARGVKGVKDVQSRLIVIPAVPGR